MGERGRWLVREVPQTFGFGYGHTQGLAAVVSVLSAARCPLAAHTAELLNESLG